MSMFLDFRSYVEKNDFAIKQYVGAAIGSLMTTFVPF